MNTQSRSIGVRMAFTDLITQKTVVIGSSHWPTVQDGRALDSGVDSNEGDYGSNGYKDWYKQTNVQLSSTINYNWKDPIYEACAGSRSCLDDNWTGGAGGRIDFLFYNAAATSSHGILSPTTRRTPPTCSSPEPTGMTSTTRATAP